MKTLFVLLFSACVVSCLVWACSGPSDAEVDATQNAQCMRWGAMAGSSDYIQCRAQLAVNYHRKQEDDHNSNMAGAALVMGGMAAANSSAARR
jgi:hypothetical protein